MPIATGVDDSAAATAQSSSARKQRHHGSITAAPRDQGPSSEAGMTAIPSGRRYASVPVVYGHGVEEVAADTFGDPLELSEVTLLDGPGEKTGSQGRIGELVLCRLGQAPDVAAGRRPGGDRIEDPQPLERPAIGPRRWSWPASSRRRWPRRGRPPAGRLRKLTVASRHCVRSEPSGAFSATRCEPRRSASPGPQGHLSRQDRRCLRYTLDASCATSPPAPRRRIDSTGGAWAPATLVIRRGRTT